MGYHSPLPDNCPRYPAFMMKPSVLLLFLALACTNAWSAVAVPSPPQVAAKAYLLMDASSGAVLAEHNADMPLSLIHI